MNSALSVIYLSFATTPSALKTLTFLSLAGVLAQCFRHPGLCCKHKVLLFQYFTGELEVTNYGWLQIRNKLFFRRR